MQPAHERRHHSADHDVMEMRDDEIGVGHMHIDGERGEKQSRQAADRKQPDETKRVEHRRLKRDRAFVQRRGPVENFDRRRNGDKKAEQRENHSGIDRLPADKHVMTPDEKTEHGDRHARAYATKS